jgi:hypothetical protein
MVSFSNNIENKIPLLNPTLKGFPGSLKHINREQTTIKIHVNIQRKLISFSAFHFKKLCASEATENKRSPSPFTFYVKLR